MLLGALGKYGNLLYMSMLLFSSFTSKMLVFVLMAERLVASCEIPGQIEFFLGQNRGSNSRVSFCLDSLSLSL